jgi:hypothetical protein
MDVQTSLYDISILNIVCDDYEYCTQQQIKIGADNGTS